MNVRHVKVIVALMMSGLGCGSSSTPPEETPPEERPFGPESDPGTEPGLDPEGEAQDEANRNVRVGTEPCQQDSDCVPAACCHPSACVARTGPNVPNCADTMCTMECRYGTLDCGGSCFCAGGFCAARLSEDPNPQVQPQAPSP